MAKTKKEQGWQNIPAKGAYTLKPAKIVADKPEHIKKKENEEKEEVRKNKGTIPFPAGYDPRKVRRTTDGGIIRLKRR